MLQRSCSGMGKLIVGFSMLDCQNRATGVPVYLSSDSAYQVVLTIFSVAFFY